MRDLLSTIDAWRSEGVEAGRAVLIHAFGSSPRQPGAILLVGQDGRMAGSVSGGCVEGAAVEQVGRARDLGRSRVIRYGISDETAWDVGLACGGTIDVLIEPELRPEVVTAARAAVEGRASVLAIPLPRGEGETPASPVIPDDAGADSELVAAAGQALEEGAARVAEIGGRSWFLELFQPRPRLVIFGAVHTAAPLVAYADRLGYQTYVIDRRTTFAVGQSLPDAAETIVEWPDHAAEAIALGPADAVAILSHDPKLDEPAIVESLRRGCWYVGAIGSRKTQADRRERLRAAGLQDDEIGRLRGPIGLDLGGREPAEVALAIMAEIIAARRGGSGRAMRETADDAALGHPAG